MCDLFADNCVIRARTLIAELKIARRSLLPFLPRMLETREARVKEEDIDRISCGPFDDAVSSSARRPVMTDIALDAGRSDARRLIVCGWKRLVFFCSRPPRYGIPEAPLSHGPETSATLQRVSRNRPRVLGNFLLITR